MEFNNRCGGREVVDFRVYLLCIGRRNSCKNQDWFSIFSSLEIKIAQAWLSFIFVLISDTKTPTPRLPVPPNPIKSSKSDSNVAKGRFGDVVDASPDEIETQGKGNVKYHHVMYNCRK